MKPYIKPELDLIEGLNNDMIQTSNSLTVAASEDDVACGIWDWNAYLQ